MRMMVQCALAALLVFTSGCVGEISQDDVVPGHDAQALFGWKQPVCPTAPEARSLSLFWWRTQRYVDQVVWSSDGALIAGVELSYEEKKSWDPLNGTTDKRRTCHRVFVQRIDGTERRYVGSEQPGQAANLYFMRAGSDANAYLLLQVFGAQGQDFERLAMDGSRTRIAHDDARRIDLVPSPDGQRLAQVTRLDACDVPPEGPLPDARTELRMLDEQGRGVGEANIVSEPCFALGFTWRPDGIFVTTTGVRAQAFDAEGRALGTTPVPRCVNPPTTSSWVDAQGRVLGFEDGQPRVLSQDPQLAFGCQ